MTTSREAWISGWPSRSCAMRSVPRSSSSRAVRVLPRAWTGFAPWKRPPRKRAVSCARIASACARLRSKRAARICHREMAMPATSEAATSAPAAIPSLFGRSVAPGRLLAKSHHHNSVQVPVQRRPAARLLRFLVQDGSADLLGSPSSQTVRPLSRQKLVQDDPERVHVARGGQLLAADLLRARVFWRQEPQGSLGAVHGLLFDGQDLGQAEVEELGNSLGSDQDVAGFDIPMDHEALVSVLHCRADPLEESEALGDAKPFLVAILQDVVRQGVLRRAPV